jgi:hypothetical protein
MKKKKKEMTQLKNKLKNLNFFNKKLWKNYKKEENFSQELIKDKNLNLNLNKDMIHLLLILDILKIFH